MSVESTVVIVGRSEALDLALDALVDLDLTIRVIPTVAEAERALLGVHPPVVGGLMVDLSQSPSRALTLIRELRLRIALAAVPIVVWASAADAPLLADAYRAGANSGVTLAGTHEDAIRLAQMIHYWAVANEPPIQEAFV